MKLEPRYTMSEDHTTQLLRGIVCIAESEDESKLLDAVFGDQVGRDGLIGKRTAEVECRLSDGYADHYLYFIAKAAA